MKTIVNSLRMLFAARMVPIALAATAAIAGPVTALADDEDGNQGPEKAIAQLYELQAAFHELLPGRSKEAGYRFIQVVTPAITGEEPTVGAIKIWLKEPDRRVRRLGQTSA